MVEPGDEVAKGASRRDLLDIDDLFMDEMVRGGDVPEETKETIRDILGKVAVELDPTSKRAGLNFELGLDQWLFIGLREDGAVSHVCVSEIIPVVRAWTRTGDQIDVED